MVSRINVRVEAEAAAQAEVSPLSIVFPVEKEAAVTAPDSELTEVTFSNEDSVLGEDTLAKHAYDKMESGGIARLFVLPFTPSGADPANITVDERLASVVAALRGGLESTNERNKLPHGSVDMIVLPRETTLGPVGTHESPNTNAVITRLKLYGLDNSLGAVSIVDAGPIADKDNVQATEPSLEDVQIWEAGNTDPNIMAITNRGDIAGFPNMWGSVIAASHWIRYTSERGIHAQPTNLRDLLLGADSFKPVRSFSPEDGSTEAEILTNAPNFMTSLIQFQGQHFLWGGKTQHTNANDPRAFLSNNIIAHRMVKDAKRDLFPYLMLRGTGRVLDSMQTHVQNDLSATYVPTAVADVIVSNVTLTAGHARATFRVRFYGFIEYITLVAEVFI